MTEQPGAPQQPNVPVTHIRLRIPRGVSPSEVISALEITFEDAPPPAAGATGEGLGPAPEIRPDLSCCVDASVISPFSTVSAV
jgi:hypothetical protein